MDSLWQQISQQDKCIENVRRSLKSTEEKIKMLQYELNRGENANSVVDDMDVATLNELEGDALLSLTEKKRRMNTRVRNIFRSLQDVAEKHCESSSSDKEARGILGEIADDCSRKGGGKGSEDHFIRLPFPGLRTVDGSP